MKLDGLSVSLDALRVRANRSELGSELGNELGNMSANKIALNNASIDTKTRQINVEQLTLDQVQGDLFRMADGTVNMMHLMKTATSLKTQTASVKQLPAWTAGIDVVSLNDSSFTFGDKAVQPALMMKADQVNIRLENVSSDLHHPIRMRASLMLNQTGKFILDGTATSKTAQVNVDVQNFKFTPLQPYFTQFLNITLKKGNVSTQGKVIWNAPGEIKFQGGLKLSNFAASDKETSNDFLAWKSLNIGGIDLSVGGSRPGITLGKIDLTEFYARAILSEQGKLNLQNIIAHPVAQTENVAATPTNSEVAAPLITIGAINLKDGVVNYTDNFIKPHYSMRMTGMTGSVGTIRSDQPQAAPININGKVNNEAPVALSGSLNPLFKPMLLDLKLTAAGVDLPALTTYALKYAGYPIVRGKLSLDVAYHIQNNQLEASNALKIDQLTFGDKVDGPDATHLPVPFLVSLLTDSNGMINLDLPISGTLNDPEFSIGGIIVRVLVNILEKAVMSPFSLLAHVFGGDDETSYIEFAPGSSRLTDTAKAKLDGIAKALADRTQLKLNMIGRADRATDEAGLRQHIFDRQIRKIDNTDAEDDTPITEADRARAIEKIYLAGQFEKPRNFIGLIKSLPTVDMEQRIIANTQVTDDDIRALALRRESAVYAYLTEIAHITPDRLFSIAPKLSGEGITDHGAISRVEFALRM